MTPPRSNDWAGLHPPDLAGWTPTRPLSIVIPTGGPGTVDLVLASLAAQTYPSHLLEVVVVDDGVGPPVELPEVRPETTRIIRSDASSWGSTHARGAGAAVTDGDLLGFVDADMLLAADHLAAQARWHETAEYVVTMGWKVFVGAWHGTPEDVREAVAAGTLQTLVDLEGSRDHDWIEAFCAQTDDLRSAGGLAFRVHVGASFVVHRSLYADTGGMDAALHYGGDSEIGYRLGQVGGLWVPVRDAQAYHLGVPALLRVGAPQLRYTQPYIDQRRPLPRFRRRRYPRGRIWQVPGVEVVVPIDGAGVEQVRATVDALLAGRPGDVTVVLVGPEPGPDVRRDVVADPDLDVHLLREHYRGDPRVRFVAEAAADAYPAPFRLELAPGTLPSEDAVERLLSFAVDGDAGDVLGLLPETGLPPLRLVRTAAVRRARRLGLDPAQPGVLDELWGSRLVDATDLGFGVLDGAPAGPAGAVTRTTPQVPGTPSG